MKLQCIRDLVIKASDEYPYVEFYTFSSAHYPSKFPKLY